MEAADRKHAWIRLEDELWEVEIRWKWLLTKARAKCIGNSTLLKSGNLDDGGKDDSMKKRTADKEGKHENETNSLQGRCEKREDVHELMSNSLAQFCQSVYNAVKQTSSTMNDIKGLMWYNWENETTCESFYDAIQISQQFMENLSTTWTIAFSLFRAQELELLYKAERLATQSTSAHQLSLKFIMSCWQTYLAAYCHCRTGELSQARIQVKKSIHSVGQLFAASLESSHSLMVAISQGLSTSTINQTNSHQTNGQPQWSHMGGILSSEKDKVLPQTEIEIYKQVSSSEKDGKCPSASSDSFKKDCEALSESDGKTSSSNVEGCILPPKRRRCDRHHWPFGLPCPKGECLPGENSPPRTIDSIRGAFQRPVSSYCNMQLHLSKMSLPTLGKPFPKEQKKQKEKSQNADVASQCKCCCESPDLDSGSGATDDNENFCSQSHCVTVSDCPQPEFKAREWKALIEDVNDLQTEWDTLLLDFSSNYPDHTLTPDSVFRSIQTEFRSEKSLREVAEEVEGKEESLETIMEELVSAMVIALRLSSAELERQVETWEQKNHRNQIETHSKGFDPSEALLQAKSLLFQLTQSFFSMMLLTTANNRRRVLCYTSLLPESLAESRKFAYNLTLAREIFGDQQPTREQSSAGSGSYPISSLELAVGAMKPAAVNPHPLCQYLALALCKAHAFSNKFTSSFTTEAKAITKRDKD